MTRFIGIASRLAAACLLLLFATAANAADPYGTWLRPSTGTQVSFYACGGKLCARIAAVSAFFTSGRLIVIVRTPSVSSTTSVSTI